MTSVPRKSHLYWPIKFLLRNLLSHDNEHIHMDYLFVFYSCHGNVYLTPVRELDYRMPYSRFYCVES